eukprot:10984237-Alexandrium_andersonii.AAC.1
MSASLVGSEMCIRDRASAGLRGGTTASAEGGVASSPFGAVVPSPEPCPVSYTHLTLPTICSV